MVKKVKKIPFPDFLLEQEDAPKYLLELYKEGVSEDGSPEIALSAEGTCIFSEKSKRIIDSEGKQIVLLGKTIIKGDIASTLKTVSDGTIIINERKYEIHAGYRPRNPDGTIHHTMFEIK